MRIAVIGAGINGILTSYYLSKRHQVTLIEKNHDVALEASNANATLLLFKPNFNIFDFPPDIKSIYTATLLQPDWCVNYMLSFTNQTEINNMQDQLSSLSKQEFIKNHFPLYKSLVYEDNELLEDTYILNCRKFAIDLMKTLNIQLILKRSIKEIIGGTVIKLKLDDDTELETDAIVFCTGFHKDYPILPVTGISLINSQSPRLKDLEESLRADVHIDDELVISQNNSDTRYSGGAIVRDATRKELFRELFDGIEKQVQQNNFHYDQIVIAARPVTPDGLPIIDKYPDHPNIYVNIGHGFYGWTWSFASAKLVSGLINNDLAREEVNIINKLKADRFTYSATAALKHFEPVDSKFT